MTIDMDVTGINRDRNRICGLAKAGYNSGMAARW